MIEAPAGVSLGLVPAPDGSADLDHVVLRVPDPDETAAALAGLGFHARDGGVELGSRHVALRRSPPPDRPHRPLLNHLALLVDSVDETLRGGRAASDVEVDRVVDAPNTFAVFVCGPDRIKLEYVEHKPSFSLV